MGRVGPGRRGPDWVGRTASKLYLHKNMNYFCKEITTQHGRVTLPVCRRRWLANPVTAGRSDSALHNCQCHGLMPTLSAEDNQQP